MVELIQNSIEAPDLISYTDEDLEPLKDALNYFSPQPTFENRYDVFQLVAPPRLPIH